MNIFNMFKSKQIEPTGKKASSAGLEAVFNYDAQARTNLSYNITNANQAIEAFYAISYVGFCSSLRANSIAKTDFNITDIEGKEITGLKVEALLRRPVAQVKRYNFIKSVGSHLLLDGNSIIWKAKDNGMSVLDNKPSSLIPLNPANVQIYDDMGNMVKATTHRAGYKIGHYRVSWINGDLILPPSEVIHINAGNPVNLIRGMGIVQQNGSLLEADKIQDMFNKAFFERGAVSNIIMSQKSESDYLPDDYKTMVKDFKKQYGIDKDPIMVAPPGTEVKELNLNYEQLQFIDLRKLSKENVMMMFRIPRSMAAMENQFVAKDEDKIAWEMVLEDDYVLIEDALTDFIREYEGRDDIFYKFKRANTIDAKNKAEVGAFLFDRGALSPQAYNAMVTGTVDEELSDDTYLPFNMMSVESINDPETQAPEDTTAKHICGHDHKKVSNFKQRQHLAAIKSRAKAEESIYKISKDYFKGLEERVLKGYEKGMKGVNDVWNDSIEEEELMKNAKRMFTSAISISIPALNELYGSKVSTEFSRIKLVVEKLSKNYVSNTLNNRKEDVRAIIEKALNGNSVAEIKNEIQAQFGNDFTGSNAWKAQRIARTESTNAYNQASQEVFKDLGVQLVDVIGCEDDVIMPGETYGCNSTNIPIDLMDSINFHPNHTGTFVIQERG